MESPSNARLIRNIATLVTLDPARQNAANPLGEIRDAALFVRDGKVAWTGPQAEFANAENAAYETIDAQGAVATPGLIDSHTHAVFGGSREDEFARRLAGVPYMQIAAEGGGIHRTVRDTRAASEEWLFLRAKAWLFEMLAEGVTTVEIKSGYGLDLENELKQLRVIARLTAELPLRVVPTFMGAHEIPIEYKSRRAAYVDRLCGELLPTVAEAGLARFCDVFCEEGVFTVSEARRILTTAKALGLAPRMHADEFVCTEGALLAAELGCASADHLMAVSQAGIEALAQAGVVAGLLPATTYMLGSSQYAPARKLLEHGVKVALATDFNPGSCCCSNLPLVMNMGATQLRMRFDEVLTAVTANAADSLRLHEETGRLLPGFAADLVLWDIPRPEYLIYHLGRHQAHAVFCQGRLAYQNPAPPVFAPSNRL